MEKEITYEYDTISIDISIKTPKPDKSPISRKNTASMLAKVD